MTSISTTIDSLRELLVHGNADILLAQLASLDASARRTAAKKLTAQAKDILAAPGGEVGNSTEAWQGALSEDHLRAAVVSLLASKPAVQAAKVWPLPQDLEFNQRVLTALFPTELDVFVEQWCEDFAKNPKHWDRNVGRDVMFELMETGSAAITDHPGAALWLMTFLDPTHHVDIFAWLDQHPRLRETIFSRILSTPGIKAASLAQLDSQDSTAPVRTQVIPKLVARGMWTKDFVREQVVAALELGLPAFQHRWLAKLAADFAE